MKLSKKMLETVVLPSISTVWAAPFYEAYGKKVCAYVWTPKGLTLQAFQTALEAKGCKVNREYESSATVEIENISYFKAYGWNK
jgi:hypothetical protein